MPLPILTVAEMRAWEKQTWASGRTESEVIERVGRELAQEARALTKPGDRILILAGKGHNGDDALASIPHLQDREFLTLRASDPLRALDDWTTTVQSRGEPERPRIGLIIDGLFGIGLNRPLSKDWVAFIHTVNSCSIPILAVDVPSGLDADTGKNFGAAINAAVTLTVGAPKKGLLAASAWPHVGKLKVTGDVGLIRREENVLASGEMEWVQESDFEYFPPPRPVAGHKGTFGHLGIVAGSRGYHGAGILAARGAQRAQPGLISLLTVEKAYVPIASQLQSVMVDVWQAGKDIAPNCTALLFGPGLEKIPRELQKQLVRAWREFPIPVVVDASGLNWLPRGEEELPGLRIITPHPGEAARMLGVSAAEVQSNRLAALRSLQQDYNQCRVVLKGHQTLVGSPGQIPVINSSGTPELGQGGSGDLLGGFIAGLIAQPLLQKDPDQCLRYAVWKHGRAADRLSQQSKHWTVEELAGSLESWTS